MPENESLEDYEARQQAEYGTYVATQLITHNGAPAYAEGQPVPVSNVEAHGYLESGLVRRADEPAPQESPQPEPPLGQPVEITPELVEEKD